MRRKTYPYVLFFAAFWILVKDKDIEDGGVILGDEMGLSKTMKIILLLLVCPCTNTESSWPEYCQLWC